jgi:hypothetical protein
MLVSSSRNERLAVLLSPFHSPFSLRHDGEGVDCAGTFTMQTRRLSDDGSVFSFDDHDFDCPLKLKDSTIALVPPPFSITRSLSWSSFEDGHIFSKYEMPDGEDVSNAAVPELSTSVSAKAGKVAISSLSPTAHGSQDKTEPQRESRASLRRSRRRGAGGSFTCAATKGRSQAQAPDDNERDDGWTHRFENRGIKSTSTAFLDGLPSTKSRDGLNWSSHSDSSWTRKESSTTNFDYLPKAQRANLHKSSSLRHIHMHRDGSQRSLFSAASAHACAGSSRPRGRRSSRAMKRLRIDPVRGQGRLVPSPGGPVATPRPVCQARWRIESPEGRTTNCSHHFTLLARP